MSNTISNKFSLQNIGPIKNADVEFGDIMSANKFNPACREVEAPTNPFRQPLQMPPSGAGLDIWHGLPFVRRRRRLVCAAPPSNF